MDTIKAFGGTVKAVGDGKVEGWAVRFTGPDAPDLEGDYFDAKTYFGRVKDVDLYYDHGQDDLLRRRVVGFGTLEVKDAGLWFAGQLSMRDEYEAAIYRLVEEGKTGFSTGAVGHLVEREDAGKTRHIKHWPIGEVSITTSPAAGPVMTKVSPTKGADIGDTNTSETAEAEATEAKVAPAVVVEVEPVTTTQQTKTNTPDMENTSNTGVPQFDVDGFMDKLDARIDAKFASIKAPKPAEPTTEVKAAPAAPAIITERGDSEIKAFSNWVRTGDMGGVKHLQTGEHKIAVKASNDSDWNIGTAADGGHTVTDDMANRIIARRDEARLSNKLGVRRFTGTGTTIDVPKDDEADGEFVSTNEAAAFDRDQAALAQTSLTLVKYTKKIQISYELLQDTATNLMEFVGDFVGRGAAKTHNNLLVTESVANGSILKTTASGTALAVGELEDAAFTNNLVEYLDGPQSGAWVMAPATYGKILQLGSTSNRFYAPQAQGSEMGPTLLGYPVHFSQKVDAYGTADNDFIHFAAWNDYMGLYESPEFEFLRDPYSSANTGQINLFYYFRCDYGVLQAEAGGFVRHLST